MNQSINHIRASIYIAFIGTWLMLFHSCSNEPYYGFEEEEGQVIFIISVPGASHGSIRTLSVTDETNITEIDVFIFDAGGSGMFLDYKQGEDITDDAGGDPAKKIFSLQMPPGTFDLVILANSRQYIDDMLTTYYPSGIPTSTTVAEIQSRLLFENTGKWSTDNTSANYRHIPMWGEKDGLIVNQDGTVSNNTEPVNMLRAIAKIDVIVDQSTQAAFQLKSVSLYNYSQKGAAIPLDAVWDNTNYIVTSPSLPTGHALTEGPLTYTQTDLPTGQSMATGLSSAIYTLEAPKGDDANFPAFTCLVVGGTYAPENKDYYYRINFLTDDISDYRALLRNYHYTITIESIDGPGSDTEDEAYKSVEPNITVSIYAWDVNDINAEPGKNYYLSVQPGIVELDARSFSATDTENVVTIQTDYPGGWAIDPASIKLPDDQPAPWLTINQLSGNRDMLAKVPLLLDANDTGQQRTAFFTVKAGPIEYPVQVVQSIIGLQDITITPIGLIPATGQQRTVTATGYFNNIPIRAWNTTDNVQIHSNTIQGTSVPQAATLDVPVLWNEDDRTTQKEIIVDFEYQHPVSGQWQTLRTDIQQSYYLKHELQIRQENYNDAPEFLWLLY